MWSLYILVNKLLKLEEREENGFGEDGSRLVGSSSLKLSAIDGMNKDAVLPHSCFIEVPHINQLYNWDCGLACALMVLRTIGINNCDLQDLAKLCSTKSVWTVDLAYILQKFSVSFSYFTVTLGANPNFSVETFYKDHLPDDLVRVDMLFEKALEAGVKIECRSLGQQEISLLILSGKYVAIALVDQYKLSRSWLKGVCIADFYNSSLGYTGHYIIICGYDAVNDEFEIRDPASSRKHERVPSRCLDEARRSFGTDEDLLLISLEKR
ncbi:Complement component 1 Q subcomponent-binding protein, mitochondrial [Ancistrocladus abbreviatus]